MLTLVLCAALSQNPRVAVVQSSNLGVSPKRSAELTNQLVDLLISEKLDPIDTKVACDNRACLVAAGKKLGAVVVISVALAALGKETVMDLEAVLVDDTKSLSQTTFTAKPGVPALPFEAVSFAADLRRVLGSSTPPSTPKVAVQDDAPKTPALTPEPTPPKPELVTEPATPSKSLAPGIALGAGAVVAGVVALVMYGIGEPKRRDAVAVDPSGSSMSIHTRSEAEGLASSANILLNMAGTLGITAGALALASMLMFVL